MASKRGIRRKACKGKVRYETIEAAKLVIHCTYRGLTPYRCVFCGGWHIGHKKRRHPAKQ